MTTASFKRTSNDHKDFQRWQFATLSTDQPRAPDEQTVADASDAELAHIRDGARTEGYATGFASGRADAADAVAAEARHLRTLAAALDAARITLQEETAQALLELAIDIAQHILRCELTQNPASLLPAVRETVELSGSGAHPQLFLNPGDLEFVRRHLGDDLTVHDWRLAEDARIEPGGCRAVNAEGSVDATLTTRWKKVAAALGVAAPVNDIAAAARGSKDAV